MTLAAPRVKQAGDVSANRFVVYVAARHLSVDTGAAEATILAPTGVDGGLVHTGLTDVTGPADTRRILLATAKVGGGTAVRAGGRIGAASPAGYDLAVAAGRNPFGIAIALPENDALFSSEIAGGRVTLSATRLPAVTASGPGRFDFASLAVLGADARVDISGGTAFATAGDLSLVTTGTAALTVAGTVAMDGATRLVASAHVGRPPPAA